MKNFLILLISLFFLSCQQKENKMESENVYDSDLKTKNIEEEKKEVNTQIDDTIVMNFKNEEGYYEAEGSIDSIHSRVYVKFQNKDLGVLKAKIIPTNGKGNIRFNQIIFPDKNSDGPFGMDMNIDLKQKGNYILIIGRSLMADNPYWGKFTVQLENDN